LLGALGRRIGADIQGGFGTVGGQHRLLHHVDDRRAGKREATGTRNYSLSCQL
jgi:hypothetical protein